jgi:integrase
MPVRWLNRPGLTITPHNLRDTAASLTVHAGASVVAVVRLLGHESATTTTPGTPPTNDHPN